MCGRPSITGQTHAVCFTKYAPDGLTAAFLFQSPVKELIHELKYRGVTHTVQLSAQLLAAAVTKEAVSTVDYIMAVPMHAIRKRERGFNQAELLANGLSTSLNLPVYAKALRRIRPTASQTKLDRTARQANVAQAFTCKESLKGKRILLIDDTVTTGATVKECTKVLKRAGASWVWVATLAQTPLGRNSHIK